MQCNAWTNGSALGESDAMPNDTNKHNPKHTNRRQVDKAPQHLITSSDRLIDGYLETYKLSVILPNAVFSGSPKLFLSLHIFLLLTLLISSVLSGLNYVPHLPRSNGTLELGRRLVDTS